MTDSAPRLPERTGGARPRAPAPATTPDESAVLPAATPDEPAAAPGATPDELAATPEEPAAAAPAATPDEPAAAPGRTAGRAPAGESSAVPDILAPGLIAVFCGINPGRASAAAGAHFANPRNDFWRLLHDAGFTPRLFAPADQHALPQHGLGLTNAARRTTRGSGDLRRGDFATAPDRLAAIARDLAPGAIAFVGKEAYRGAFGERAALGPQGRTLGATRLFVLPSTSPANAAVPYAERLRWFRELRDWLEPTGLSRASGS